MWYSVTVITHGLTGKLMTPNDVASKNNRVIQLGNSLLCHIRFIAYSGDAASLPCDEASRSCIH